MSQEILQQLLNRSLAHVRQQGKPSIKDDRLTCLYRSPDGCGCAAAPFITNYSPEMENKTWMQVASMWLNNVEPAAAEHAVFVNNVLQVAHDDAARIVGKDFLEAYEEIIQYHVYTWNLDNGTSLTIPPRGWEVV